MRERLDPDMAEAMAFEAARDAGLPPPVDLDEERARGRDAAAFWNEGLPEMAAIEDHVVAGPEGPVPVRVFKPVDSGPLPVMLYIHGGGWVVGSVVQNEPLIRTLAARSGWAIAAPTYRLAPEHPYPAGLDDNFAAGQWLLNEGAAHGLDASRMVVSGTSAGGNLALAAAVSGRLEALAGLVLFYGVFGADLDTASYRRFADGRFGLSRERMAYFLDLYDPTGRHRTDPLLQPLLAELAGLPPTWLLAAGLDVLRSDTLALHSRLIEAGVRSTLHVEPGVVHGFINRGRMVGAARRSLDGAAHFLRSLTRDTP
ncbi:MAG: alpha/beta hydrolase [Geminicoccaceae bacterium]